MSTSRTPSLPLLASILALPALAAAAAAQDAAAPARSAPKEGNEMQSIGPLAFGPGGVLFAADPAASAVFAIATGDARGEDAGENLSLPGIDAELAALLGTTAGEIQIHDLAVNPETGHAFLSASRGRGPQAEPVIARVSPPGALEVLAIAELSTSRAELPNPPDSERRRGESITDLGYVDGRLFVAGLSNEEFASKLRTLPFPFAEVGGGTSIEIYHGSHGEWETRAPVRTFAPYVIAGEAHLLAAYTCTPLVTIPISELAGADKVRGTTVAELGNRNVPLDMVVYEKDGLEYLLVANSARGVMKVSLAPIGAAEGITSPVGGPAGLAFETVEHLAGVTQLDRLDRERAVVLLRGDSGMDLETIELP